MLTPNLEERLWGRWSAAAVEVKTDSMGKTWSASFRVASVWKMAVRSSFSCSAGCAGPECSSRSRCLHSSSPPPHLLRAAWRKRRWRRQKTRRASQSLNPGWACRPSPLRSAEVYAATVWIWIPEFPRGSALDPRGYLKVEAPRYGQCEVLGAALWMDEGPALERTDCCYFVGSWCLCSLGWALGVCSLHESWVAVGLLALWEWDTQSILQSQGQRRSCTSPSVSRRHVEVEMKSLFHHFSPYRSPH